MNFYIYFFLLGIITQNIVVLKGQATMNSRIRTDLALEAEQLFRAGGRGSGDIPGVRASERLSGGFTVSTIEVLDERGESAIGKPRGRYVTVELGALLRREQGAPGELLPSTP